MKQLEIFIMKLRNAGYLVTTNWQQPLNRGIIQHSSILNNVKSINVIFIVYEGDNGYQTYLDNKENTFDGDLKSIKNILD